MINDSTQHGDLMGHSVFSLAKEELYVIGSIYVAMSVLGIVFNSITIFVVSRGNSVGKEFKIQLINLAFADLLMAVIDPAIFILFLFKSPVLDNLGLCKAVCIGHSFANYTSLLCNEAICLERFVIVFFPLRASRYTRTHKFVVVKIIWVCSSLISASGLIISYIYGETETCYCQVAACVDTAPFSMLSPWLRMMMYAQPAITIAIIYTAIFVKLNFHKSSEIRRNAPTKWKRDLEKVKHHA